MHLCESYGLCHFVCLNCVIYFFLFYFGYKVTAFCSNRIIFTDIIILLFESLFHFNRFLGKMC